MGRFRNTKWSKQRKNKLELYYKLSLQQTVEGFFNQTITYKQIPIKISNENIIRKVAKFFTSTNPTIRVMGYQLLMADKRLFYQNEDYLLPRKSKEKIEEILDFCYFIQRQKWLRKGTKELMSYPKLMYHLFVKEGVKIPPYLFEPTFLMQEDCWDLFLKVAKGGNLRKLLSRINIEFTNEEYTLFLKIKKPMTINEAANYATLRSMNIVPVERAKQMANDLKTITLSTSKLRRSVLMFYHRLTAKFSVNKISVVRDLDMMVQYSKQWVRDIKDFEIPDNKSWYDVIRLNLTKYLFEKYTVSPFFTSKLGTISILYFEWYVQLGQGFSPKTLHRFPFALSQQEAHWINDAPSNFSIEEGYYFAKVRAVGGSVVLAQQLAKSISKDRVEDKQFLKNIIFFFVRNYPQGHDYNRGIYRYLLYLRKTMTAFRLKGRSGQNILSRCIGFYKKWLGLHHQTISEQSLAYAMNSIPYNLFFKQNNYWNPKPISNFEYQTSRNVRYEIKQINSQMELFVEGQVMSHCVASYRKRCEQGACSIWTFSRYDENNYRKRILTIELRDQRICQAKGKHNSRNIRASDLDVLVEWVRQAKLRFNVNLLKVVS